MPHAELKFSNDLAIDAPAILASIEAVIQNHDAGSGDCKGRAYPAAEFHHTHLIAEISMLPKAHRDAAFMKALTSGLEATIKSHLTQPCFFSLMISFSLQNYVTNRFEP
jgi:hypothetical protein